MAQYLVKHGDNFTLQAKIGIIMRVCFQLLKDLLLTKTDTKVVSLERSNYLHNILILSILRTWCPSKCMRCKQYLQVLIFCVMIDQKIPLI